MHTHHVEESLAGGFECHRKGTRACPSTLTHQGTSTSSVMWIKCSEALSLSSCLLSPVSVSCWPSTAYTTYATYAITKAS